MMLSIKTYNNNAKTTQKRVVLILLFVCLFAGSLSYSQTQSSVPDALANQLHIVSKNRASESVYLQTSKGIYETGEDLWFKGYVLNSQFLTPSLQSKTLYVQLIEDTTNKAVWEEKYEIENGFVDGHLYVQDTLQVGSYTLAAYTPHSLYNDKQPIQSIRQLHIVKNITSYYQTKQQGTLTLVQSKSKEIDFQLFPEGGHLVSGIAGNVAFKAVDAKGNPKTVSGALYENGKPICTFKSMHAGMGAFSFTPSYGNRYHITLDSLETREQYTLPTINTKGHVLQLLNNDKDALTFKVEKNTNTNKETVFLRVQTRGVVYSIAKAIVDKEQLIKIPLKDLPQGIAEVALFNKNLQPVAERLVYVNQDQRLNIKAILDKGEYLTKGKAKLKLKVTDQNNNPVAAHLGLSVFDKFYNNPKDSKTIESHYHLSTQLEGRLYNPSYYFDENNTNRKQALDLLLLTQGWRAYQWTEANLKQETLKKHQVINDTVTGKLYANNKKDQAVLSQQYVMGFTADKQSSKSFIDVDSIGRFTVYPNEIQQAKRGYLYLKLLLSGPKNKIDITINDPSFSMINRLRKQKTFSYPIAPKLKPQIIRNLKPFVVANDVNKLEEVIVTGKTKRVFRDRYMGTLDSLAKLGMNAGDYICVSKILNCEIHKNSHDNKKPIDGEIYEKYIGFRWINEEGGPYTFSNLSRITYKYPQLTEAELLKKFNLTSIKGYYGKKEFYSPIYDTVEQTDGFPDYRNTLYWKPDIITDEKGEATVSFYCSDINTKFIGTIEGVSGNGLIGTENFDFKVRKSH